jgi:hypothetical protein
MAMERLRKSILVIPTWLSKKTTQHAEDRFELDIIVTTQAQKIKRATGPAKHGNQNQ